MNTNSLILNPEHLVISPKCQNKTKTRINWNYEIEQYFQLREARLDYDRAFSFFTHNILKIDINQVETLQKLYREKIEKEAKWNAKSRKAKTTVENLWSKTLQWALQIAHMGKEYSGITSYVGTVNDGSYAYTLQKKGMQYPGTRFYKIDVLHEVGISWEDIGGLMMPKFDALRQKSWDMKKPLISISGCPKNRIVHAEWVEVKGKQIKRCGGKIGETSGKLYFYK